MQTSSTQTPDLSYASALEMNYCDDCGQKAPCTVYYANCTPGHTNGTPILAICVCCQLPELGLEKLRLADDGQLVC